MKQMIAAEVMSPQVLAVDPDMTVHELVSFLTDNQISGAPVLDRRGKLVGVVSETDIAEAELERTDPVDDRSDPAFDLRGWEEEAEPDEIQRLHLHAASGLTVRDIMTPTAYTVPHDTPVKEIARTMVTGQIHRLLVTREGHVVGIVTSLDLVKLLYADDVGAGGGARPRPRSVLVRN
jgi:CBS domain-containing protein